MTSAENISFSTTNLVKSWSVQSAEAATLIASNPALTNEEEDRSPKKGSKKLYALQPPKITSAAPQAATGKTGAPNSALLNQYTTDIQALLDALENGDSSDSLDALLSKVKADLTQILVEAGATPSDAAAQASAAVANITNLSKGQLKPVLADLGNLLKAFSNGASEQEIEKILNKTLDDMSATSSNGPSSDPDAPGTPGVDKLIAYFVAILLIQVSLSKDQSKLDGEISSMTNSLVQVCAEQAKKASDDLQKYMEELKEQQSESWFQKAFSSIASVCLFAIGAITGQPELCAIAAIMLVMQLSGGQDALNGALADCGAVGKYFAQVGIAIGEAVLTCGIAGAASGGAIVAEDAGEEAGDNAVADATEDAGANGSANSDGAINGSNQAVEESSAISRAVDRIVGGKFAGANLLSQTSKMLMLSTFWQDLFTVIAKGCGASDDTANIVGASVGTAVGFATAGGLSFTEAETNPAFSMRNWMTENIGNDAYNGAKSILKVGTATFNIASGAYGIEQGNTLKDEADVQRDQATTYATLTIYQGLIDQLNAMFTQLNTVFTNVQSQFGDIMQSANKYLTPYDPNSYSA